MAMFWFLQMKDLLWDFLAREIVAEDMWEFGTIKSLCKRLFGLPTGIALLQIHLVFYH